MKYKSSFLTNISFPLLILIFLPISLSAVAVPATSGNLKIVLDRSSYTLPNGMSYQQVLNMNQAITQTSGFTFLSATTMGLTGNTQIGQMAVDELGNRYVTGGFTGSIQYGNIVVESSGGYDVFIAKLNPKGEVLWYQIANGSSKVAHDFSLEGGLTLALDNEDNLYVGGSFVKELSFTSSDGQVLKTLHDGRDDELINLELFVAKYDVNGTFLWALGGESGSTASEANLNEGINSVNTIMIDSEGYPYLAGGFSGSNLLGVEATTNGNSDFFIASVSKEGDEIYWADVFGTPNRDYATSISIDTLGYLNILGILGEGVMNLPNSDISWNNDSGNEDSFIISYDVNGEWYFASFMGAGERVAGNSISSTKDGSIYVGGFFSGSATFEGSDETFNALGSEDAMLVKYDLEGDMIWMRHFGFDYASVDVIKLDENEDVLILGRYLKSIIFEAESDSPVALSTDSPNSMFMAKYDKMGNFIWAKNIDGTGRESVDIIYDEQTRNFGTNPLDIIVSSYNEGEIILAGDFDGSLTLDDINLNSNGNRVAFMAVISTSETVSNEQKLIEAPNQFELLQNYPNPFNPKTNIAFILSKASQVSIEIYTLMGQRVATIGNSMFGAGKHTIAWDASTLASGTYMYSLKTDNYSETKKMTLIK
jgi:hypothetical protein